MPEFVTPGQRLGFTQNFKAGPGTYIRGSHIYASVVGVRKDFVKKDEEKIPIITVSREKKQSAVPDVNSIITGKVIRINPKEAFVSIMVVGNVRATEKDKVKIYNSFRPGDIVRAEVISLGDARSYTLSTAKNELGVIYAQSVAGAPMIPKSWQEMICTKTKIIELRKCAKPI
ncbi:5415_t:CDS:2 [Entrophospora sp. SA101]|nr:5415_t:CDS:2 [Entrophospora sp. SA101]